MGKEERGKRREDKEQQEALEFERAEKAKLHALDSVIKLLRKNKIQEDKIIIGNTRFSLFDGKDYAEIVERHYEQIAKSLDKAFKAKLQAEKETSKRRISLTNFLLSNQAIFRVEENKEALKIRNSNDKFIPKKEQQVSKDEEILEEYFVFNPRINVQPKSSYVYMVLILLGIALVILFPVWPLSLKRGIFYLSLLILFLLIGLIIVRTLLYFIVRVFGYDFYLFPNLFQDVSFFDSFKPIIGYEKCNDSKLFIAIRTLGIFAVIGVIYWMSIERHNIHQFGQQSFDDILEWGYSKLEGSKAPPPKSIEQIMEDIDRQYSEGGIANDIDPSNNSNNENNEF